MRNSKKNYVIVALVVILLALAIGYSAFSATLTINGTANMSGKFTVQFVENFAKIDENHEFSTTPTVSGDEATVAVDLKYPGDAAEVTLKVENKGNVDAVLKNFDVTVAENAGITVEMPAITGDELPVNDVCEFTFVVKANKKTSDQDNTTVELAPEGSASFTITLNYEQDTTDATANTAHNH